MTWRQTEQELITAVIVRALRRDPIANGSRGWRSFVQRLADRIEQNEIVIGIEEEKSK